MHAIQGATGDSDGGSTGKGAVYVFEYESKWILKNKISDNAGDAGKIDVSFLGLGGESYFGNSLEIYDDLLIIGEQDKGGEALFEGAAHIFKISGGEFNYSETISNGYPNN